MKLMKQKFLLPLALAGLVISAETNAQNRAFAVTGETKGNFTWNVIREVDLSTGDVVRTIYNPSENKAVKYQVAPGSETRGVAQLSAATGANGLGVAAAAFDAVHNRLYYTNMRGAELLYFDFNSNDLSVVINNDPVFNTGNKFDEGNVITRMTFGCDGYGYALTNDGKSLVRFTTGQKPTVANLGELIDGKKNGSMSVHSQCSSWGGDMVGDIYGNLYLVTYRNHIFKINPNTRVADYVGAIKGLPEQFTSNAMVVDDNGELLVASATTTDNYYHVNISTLEATSIMKNGSNVYNCSDLASGNLLYQSKKAPVAAAEVMGNSAISIYPNPVPSKNFSVQFDKLPAGKYTLVLSDASGRSVVNKVVTVNAFGQVEKVTLPKASSGGMYMVKVLGSDSKVVYNDRIVVE